MNQSNECKQHTLSCMHQIQISNQGLQTNQYTHYTIKYSAIRTKKSQPKPYQLPPKTHK